ncbi:hypothetical protein [Mucispirillum schaedleri]|uniref:hypothetical protein n=1 Tax=Mucispirillum schaedleri TaxID=248039 RepID=UPI001F5A9E93|nr:hypothetical protein [Mucispirillum schaedleri]
MKKFTTLILAFICISAIYALNLSTNCFAAAPNSYETLVDNNEVKKITYSCVFDNKKYAYPTCKFEERCEKGSTCFKVSDLDYVSFFVSFNFQAVEILASDYIMNLARSYEKDEKNLQLSYLSALFNPVKRTFYDDETKNLLFQKMLFTNMQPSSFVTKTENDVSIFLSKKDVFLRNTIYPSLKLNGITYDKSKQLEYITESSLQYSVYPHAYEVGYVTEWMAQYVGAPELYKNEKNISQVVVYFDELKKGKDKIEDHSGSAVLESEKARPFVFENKIAKFIQQNKDKDLLLPSLPKQDNHFLNEYLPKFTLEKIEIIEKNGKNEKVLKKYDKNNIAELLISNEEIAGFAYRVDNISKGILLIRYTHTADAPRYENPGLLKLKNSGLNGIYGKLRKTIVTDLEITVPYELTSLPYDCIEKVDVAKILSKKGVSEKEISAYLSLFNDKNTQCIDSELFMTKVIFLRDFRE